MVLAPPASAVSSTPAEARSDLAAEWASRAPVTPAEIHRFYRESEHLGADLAAFHADPARQGWTRAIVYLAQTQEIGTVVDIGCGAGHDLVALHDQVPGLSLHGVEPNDALRERLAAGLRGCCDPRTWSLASEVAFAPVERADLLVCIDVLEHIPDPETFLSGVARRAKIGAWLTEATATHDCGTPLHLKENRGWHPGHALEAAGWELIQTQGRFRVWRRVREAAEPRATLMLCAYRTCTLPTLRSVLNLKDAYPNDGWRVYMGGEAGIHRTRNVAASRWLRETADDVCVMIDDDIVFRSEDVARLVAYCRDGHDVICGAYPVRDGGHLALRQQPGELWFGEGQPPIEVAYMATGFVAIHRRVFEAMVPTLPLCHPGGDYAHWPFFSFREAQNEQGDWEHLSEDFDFSQKARDLGFSIWLDQATILGHIGSVEFNVRNMNALHDAISKE